MKRPRFGLDSVGVAASALCLVHCIGIPLLFATLALWKGVPPREASGIRQPALQLAGMPLAEGGCCSSAMDSWIHLGFFALVAPVGLVAWGVGYWEHRRAGILALGVTGVILLISALLFGSYWLSAPSEKWVTVAGSLCMVGAHLWNQRHVSCCSRFDRIGSRCSPVSEAHTPL